MAFQEIKAVFYPVKLSEPSEDIYSCLHVKTLGTTTSAVCILYHFTKCTSSFERTALLCATSRPWKEITSKSEKGIVPVDPEAGKHWPHGTVFCCLPYLSPQCLPKTPSSAAWGVNWDWNRRMEGLSNMHSQFCESYLETTTPFMAVLPLLTSFTTGTRKRKEAHYSFQKDL